MEITREKYHHVMALWIIAKRKQKEVTDLEKEANDLIEEEVGSHLSDSIYDWSTGTNEKEFVNVMERMRISVVE